MSYSTDATSGRKFLQMLGSFWSNVFEQSDELAHTLFASDEEASQSYLNFVEALYTLSRFSVPVFHREYWYLLTIKQSERNSVKIGRLKYGDGAVYGPQPDNSLAPVGTVFKYGDTLPNTYAYPIDSELKFCSAIMDRIFNAELIWTAGTDFYLVDGAIVFSEDPFDRMEFSARPIFDSDGNVTDYELSLWALNTDWDKDYIYKQFGYVLDIEADSAEAYKNFLNALWNMYVAGPTRKYILDALAAATNVPYAETTETVESIEVTDDRILVLTDKNVHKFESSANLLVSAGDMLHKGDCIVDAYQLITFESGVPSETELPQLAFGSEFISGGLEHDLIFKNEELPTEYLGVDEDGKAEFRFKVYGLDSDVEKFWASVQEKGKQSQTLAELLDIRENPTDQPKEESLPSTLNPMEFMITNVFGNNLFVIKIKPDHCDLSLMGMDFLGHIKAVLQPHVTFIVHVELEAPDEEIQPDEDESSGDILVASEESEDIITDSEDVEVADDLFYSGV